MLNRLQLLKRDGSSMDRRDFSFILSRGLLWKLYDYATDRRITIGWCKPMRATIYTFLIHFCSCTGNWILFLPFCNKNEVIFDMKLLKFNLATDKAEIWVMSTIQIHYTLSGILNVLIRQFNAPLQRNYKIKWYASCECVMCVWLCLQNDVLNILTNTSIFCCHRLL